MFFFNFANIAASYADLGLYLDQLSLERFLEPTTIRLYPKFIDPHTKVLPMPKSFSRNADRVGFQDFINLLGLKPNLASVLFWQRSLKKNSAVH